MLKLMGKKYLQFYAQKFCLFKPMLKGLMRLEPLLYLYLSFVWPGRSLLEYCLDKALKSPPSPLPFPPRAGSNVGLAAVVMVNHSPENRTCMVNVLKFGTLFSFCSQIKCWFSGLEFTKWMSE